MSWKLRLMPLSLFSHLLSPFLLEQQVWLRWSRVGAGGSPRGGAQGPHLESSTDGKFLSEESPGQGEGIGPAGTAPQRQLLF